LSDFNFYRGNVVDGILEEITNRENLNNPDNLKTNIPNTVTKLTPLQVLSSGTSLLPYDSLLLDGVTPHIRKSISYWSSWVYMRNYEKRFKTRYSKNNNNNNNNNNNYNPLSLYYISYDFRDHPMGHLTLQLVTNHANPTFHTTAISYGDNDQSFYRTRFENDVDVFIEGKRGEDVDVYGLVEVRAMSEEWCIQ
jgi:hypothetical protein